MTLIRNERTKLTATYFNGIAIAVFAIGAFAPIITGIGTNEGPAGSTFTVSIICVFVSSVVHLGARFFLKGLDQ
ncbi:amino acid transporter [Phyllobacterium leguminum]|uniref:Amino acid transporter n=1 Tax=Phyllobacterium leguminum TaxID=314237 RepID=A0A318T3A6_9HYPH|nr:amino acid transporter [Phyllobacterium leguminum]PYE88462.1 hypothetical protein C7477_107105 [Phyllobacterium leguminum]